MSLPFPVSNSPNWVSWTVFILPHWVFLIAFWCQEALGQGHEQRSMWSAQQTPAIPANGEHLFSPGDFRFKDILSAGCQQAHLTTQAGFCWPRPPSPGALTQPAHGSSGSRGARSARLTAAPAVALCGREQLGSERRDCGIEHQQAYPTLATGCRFRTLPACLGKGMERLTVPGVGSCQTQ